MVEGSCLCEGVAFQIDGEVTPIQSCYARRCQKATGSAFSPEALVMQADLSWLRGEALIQTYEAPLLDRPPAYRKAFCQRCGSPLPTPIEGTPFALLQVGVLDTDPGSRPFRHAFVAQKACWHEITDDLPQFESTPPVPKRWRTDPTQA